MAMLEDGDRITVNLGGSTPVATWRAWGLAGNRFVKRKLDAEADIPSSGYSVMTCVACTAGDTEVVGLLVGVNGGDYDLQGTVLLRAADATVKGTGTAQTPIAHGNAVEANGMQFNTDNEVLADGTANGFGKIIGGTIAEPRVSFLSSLYTAGRS